MVLFRDSHSSVSQNLYLKFTSQLYPWPYYGLTKYLHLQSHVGHGQSSKKTFVLTQLLELGSHHHHQMITFITLLDTKNIQIS